LKFVESWVIFSRAGAWTERVRMNIKDIIDFKVDSDEVSVTDKIDELVRRIDEDRLKTKKVYSDKMRNLKELSNLLKDMKKSFIKGK